MKYKLHYKLISIAIIALVLLIPLLLIQGLINDRQVRRKDAQVDIGRSWANSQQVAGPILVISYREKTLEQVFDATLRQTVPKEKMVSRRAYFLPDDLTIDAHITTEERYRGIHKIPVYTANLNASGTFELPQTLGLAQLPEGSTIDEASLIVRVTDVRGIKPGLKLQWEDSTVAFAPGTGEPVLVSGVHAVLGNSDWKEARSYRFSLEMELQGMDSLDFIPVGKSTTTTMQSSWPHPMFAGLFLPEQRNIGVNGFKAVWRISEFATNARQHFLACTQGECGHFLSQDFGVAFLYAVDVYQQTERSMKYAILFVGLTFVVFFLFEILQDLSIHPIQYGLVGSALSVFYLLLLSLSEHVSFAVSYSVAAFACIGLLALYVYYVLKGLARAASFSALLIVLYGVLYVLLQSEDYSLLMGSFCVFVVLGALMFLTRKVDWYSFNRVESDAMPASTADDTRAA